MNATLKCLAAVLALGAATQAAAQITFYEGEGFRGRAFTASKSIGDFERFRFNDRASSAMVDRGRWEVCEHARFQGRCVVLRHGNYPSLAAMGMNDRISSVRAVSERGNYPNAAPPPPPAPVYEYRRRPNERLYEARVTSVHAVMGPASRRCWVERQQVGGEPNTGGAIAGAIIGGILGHQVGKGSGRDAATAAGAIAGAAIGANSGEGGPGYERNVRRCENVPRGPPAYWDVTYHFRGVEHHVEMSAPPGATILVNRRGEPRQ